MCIGTKFCYCLQKLQISSDMWLAFKCSIHGDRGRDTKFFDVGADQFFFVDTVNGLLAQAEQEWRHDGAEVEGGVAREDVVNGAQVVFTGAAVARD